MSPPVPPSPLQTMGRLLAGLESCVAAETGLVNCRDWTGLTGLLAREEILVRRLVREKQAAGPNLPQEISLRVAALRQHFAAMQARLVGARAQLNIRRSELGKTGQRVRAVHDAYRIRKAS